MNEKEKMIAGLAHLPIADKELIEGRKRCKNLCYEYNKIKIHAEL